MIRRLALVLLVVVTLVGALHAQEAGAPVEARDGGLRVTAQLDSARPALGVPTTLTLTAELDASVEGTRIEWPELGQALLGALGEDVVEVERVSVSADRLRQTATLRFYNSGDHDLPPLRVAAVRVAPGMESTPFATVEIDPGDVHVPGVAPEEADRRPSRGALGWEQEEGAGSWAWWALGAAILLLAAAGLLLRLTRGSTEPAPAPPPLPPDRRALDALDALLREELPERGLVAPFFTRLSAIARLYVEERFGLRAPEQTTEEFLVELSRRADLPSLTADHRALLREFLTRADLVKFARADADPADCTQAADDIRTFVVHTRPPAVAPVRPEPGEVPRELEP